MSSNASRAISGCRRSGQIDTIEEVVWERARKKELLLHPLYFASKLSRCIWPIHFNFDFCFTSLCVPGPICSCYARVNVIWVFMTPIIRFVGRCVQFVERCPFQLCSLYVVECEVQIPRLYFVVPVINACVRLLVKSVIGCHRCHQFFSPQHSNRLLSP